MADWSLSKRKCTNSEALDFSITSANLHSKRIEKHISDIQAKSEAKKMEVCLTCS